MHLVLENQIKTLFAAIRVTKHADSSPALREAACDSGNRVGAWKCQTEQKKEEGF
jgi:hypothetical protein